MSARIPPESPEKAAALDRMPYVYELAANVPKLINVRSRYRRAFVLGIDFAAAHIDGVFVQGIQMEHFEQLVVSPVPAKVFNNLRSIVLPIAHASLGVDVTLLSTIQQAVTIRIHFSECKRGEPRA